MNVVEKIKDWSILRLDEIVEFLDEKRVPLKESERMNRKGKYPYYGASGIIDYIDNYIFDGEFILLGEDGANIITRSTRLAFLAKGKIWVNNHAHIMKAKQGYDSYYICEYLESMDYTKYNTGTAQPKLNKEVCKNILIKVPSIKEQEKIAEILSTWDSAIEKQEKLIEKKKEFKKGLMQRLLSGEVRFKEFTEDWAIVSLGNVFERVTQKNDAECTNVLTISAQNGLVNQEDYFNKSVSSKDLSGYYLLKKGDFAYNKSYSNGYPLGAIKRLNNYDEGVVSPLYICFRAKEKISTCFYEQYFESGFLNKEIFKIAQEGARNHGLLNVSVTEFFKDIKIPKPSLEEQNKIAEVLIEADKEIELLQKELEALKLQKKGLMQRLLTGEVRAKV